MDPFHVRVAVGTLCVLTLASCAAAPDGPSRATGGAGKQLPQVAFGERTGVYLTPANTTALYARKAVAEWQPAVNRQKLRGGVEIFQAVAPGVVVVQAEDGHGTGFVVSEDGLILTNHHVVANAFVDPQSSVSYAHVFLGRMDDGRISLVDEPLRALVLGTDETRDLGLLQLEEIPQELRPLRPLQLSADQGLAGSDSAMVGHPSSGMLWTLRQCHIAALGASPRDMVNTLLPLLASTGAEKLDLEQMLRNVEPRDIVLSSCLANPGDSGSPLVDDSGAVVGVTFAIPAVAPEQKFTYHVGLEEVQAFLATADRTPQLLLPDLWNLAPQVEILRSDILTAGLEQPRQFLFDLDGDTPASLLDEGSLDRLVGERLFEAEAAFQAFPEEQRYYTFYDTDNDGSMDVILLDNDMDPGADRRYRLDAEGRWMVEEDVDLTFFDKSLFVDEPLQERLAEILELLGVADSAAAREPA